MKTKAKSVNPKTDVTNQCGYCTLFFLDNDVCITDDKGVVCLNCKDKYKYNHKNKFGEFTRITPLPIIGPNVIEEAYSLFYEQLTEKGRTMEGALEIVRDYYGSGIAELVQEQAVKNAQI